MGRKNTRQEANQPFEFSGRERAWRSLRSQGFLFPDLQKTWQICRETMWKAWQPRAGQGPSDFSLMIGLGP